jgi:protein-tyrosine phosphatase
MKYYEACLFILLGLLSGLFAFRLQGPAWILLWVGASFFLVGFAYWGVGPTVFGKRPDGRMALGSTVLLLPYLIYRWGIWRLLRRVSRENPYDGLIPGIIIGRRLFPTEYPADVHEVLDLTCEFPEFKKVREVRHYRSFPILDGHVPRLSDLLRVVLEINHAEETLYIHCAEGHGRTGFVAAAILLSRGLTSDPDEAICMVQAERPKVRLEKCQRQMLVELARSLEKGAHRADRERLR